MEKLTAELSASRQLAAEAEEKLAAAASEMNNKNQQL